MSDEGRAKRVRVCLQRQLEGAIAYLMEAAQYVLGSTHQLSSGIMEEGAEIPEWDDVKS